MVEIILSGGVGNQLHQYAFGRFLSIERNESLVLNSYRLGVFVKDETPRGLYLNGLNLNAEIVNKKRLLGRSRVLDSILRKQLIPKYSYEVPDFKSQFFFGHWINKKFPDLIRSHLLEELIPAGHLPDEYHESLQRVRTGRVLAVHVRRGDYLSNPGAAKFHGALTRDYYLRAIAEAFKWKKFDSVCIFSDDPEWCQKEFPEFRVIQPFVDNPFLDIFLMSNCDSNIIANSTFSWWGSWLNQNPEKIIIAPKHWFKDKENPPVYDGEWKIIE